MKKAPLRFAREPFSLFHFGSDVVSYPALIPPFNGLYRGPAQYHAVVEVVAACKAGDAGVADDVASSDDVALVHSD